MNDFKALEETNKKEEQREKEFKKETLKKGKIENDMPSDEEDMMECSIYTCTSCGAELVVNDVEASTFCAYCGQPTIVFSRVSSTVKPQYIIPFSVTKNQAVNAIRSHLNRGFFIPDEIKNFEIERVCGIYIPFWLYDIEYLDQQYLKGTVRHGKQNITKYYYRSAEGTFRNVTLDASKQLNDETSQRLEPYNTKAMRSFEIGYFSGFYADCYDVQSEQLDGTAVIRIKRLFDAEIQKTVHASDIQVVRSDPQYTITKTDYALFPGWFITFRHNNEPYTILVNGQTGIVIGAVPYDKPKTKFYFWIIRIVATIIATLFMLAFQPHIVMDGLDDVYIMGGGILVLCFTMIKIGRAKFRQVHNSIQLSNSASMNRFVKDRQEEK